MDQLLKITGMESVQDSIRLLQEKKPAQKKLVKEGEIYHISGNLSIDQYNCRVDSDVDVLMSQKEGDTMIFCSIYYVGKDHNVTAYIPAKYLIQQ